MTQRDEISVYLQSPTHPKQRYTTRRQSSIWPTIWLYLCSTKQLKSPVLSLSLEIVGRVRYEDVVVDLMNRQPEMFVDHMGLVDGDTVLVSQVKPAKWALKFPEPLVEGQSSVQKKKEDTTEPEFYQSSIIKVRSQGVYLCDFKGCQFSSEQWEHMTEHFKRKHDTGGVYSCPHPHCASCCSSVIEYEQHLIERHGGIKLPRVQEQEETVQPVMSSPRKSVSPKKRIIASPVKSLSPRTGDDSDNEDYPVYSLRHKTNGLYKCDFEHCQYTADNWRKMAYHFTRIHQVRGYQCPHPGCDTYFRQVGHYDGHIRSAHRGDRLPRPQQLVPMK